MSYVTAVLPTDQPPLMHQAVDEAVRLLREGEIVALPTETVYGLAANALDAEAVAKIFEAKERPTFDPLIVHLASKEQIDLVADVPPEIALTLKKMVERFWPGPLTILLPKKPIVPDLVTAGLQTVAVRVSSNAIFRRVITDLGKPIAAPSANRFGSISPTSASAVLSELDGRIHQARQPASAALGGNRRPAGGGAEPHRLRQPPDPQPVQRRRRRGDDGFCAGRLCLYVRSAAAQRRGGLSI